MDIANYFDGSFKFKHDWLLEEDLPCHLAHRSDLALGQLHVLACFLCHQTRYDGVELDRRQGFVLHGLYLYCFKEGKKLVSKFICMGNSKECKDSWGKPTHPNPFKLKY